MLDSYFLEDFCAFCFLLLPSLLVLLRLLLVLYSCPSQIQFFRPLLFLLHGVLGRHLVIDQCCMAVSEPLSLIFHTNVPPPLGLYS